MSKKNVFFIADDDTDDQEIFIKALKEIDETCECIVVSDGEAALEKLFALPLALPDFIFLDLNMPKLNGKQCLKEIKSNTRFKDVPVIIYSTSADKKDIQETTELGAAFFLQKPNRFDDLCNSLALLIGKK